MKKQSDANETRPVEWVESHGVHKTYFREKAFRVHIGSNHAGGFNIGFSGPQNIALQKPVSDLPKAKRAALKFAILIFRRALKEAEDALKRYDALEKNAPPPDGEKTI